MLERSGNDAELDVSSRLKSIDALRGLAAIAVVLYHVVQNTGAVRSSIPLLKEVLGLGFTGVWLFFVISGFCIHLRYAKGLKRGQDVTPDFLGFWKRRARRLYPAYLTALLIYVALDFAVQREFTSFKLYDLILHLSMIHNLDARTIYGFSGVFWTLALEEQLYLAYFLLLSLRRRFGWKLTLVICLLCRIGTYGLGAVCIKYFGSALMPIQGSVGAQWLVWALGALSVEAYLGIVKLPRWCSDSRVAYALLIGTGALIIYHQDHPGTRLHNAIWLFQDVLLGCGFFVLINSAAESERRRELGFAAYYRLAALSTVGIFSYSLYLTHDALITHTAGLLMGALHLGAGALIALPLLSVLVAYLFFLVAERPFIQLRPQAGLPAQCPGPGS